MVKITDLLLNNIFSYLQISEQIKALQEKLQSYKIEIATDGAKAVMLGSEFETLIQTPAMVRIKFLCLFTTNMSERWYEGG